MENEHPRPLHDRRWVGADGEQWRMRGPALSPKQIRRLLRRAGVPILLVDSPQPRLVVGQQRDELVERMEGFWAGRAEPSADFAVGEFRDDGREVLVIVQESC